MIEWQIILVYLAIGAGAGIISGLLGMGGGVVVVPALAFVFAWLKFPGSYIMHMAAGTSLAIMIFTTGRSFLSHRKRGIEFWSVYRRFVPGIIVGVILGGILAHYLHTDTLKIIFGVFLLLIAIKMFAQKTTNPTRQLPGWKGMSTAGLIIGGKSGLLGIGGGAVTVPYLTYCNVPMRQAVVVSVATGWTVAVIGSITFSLTGLAAAGLPAMTLGYIYVPAWIGVAVGSFLCAPIGAALSHTLPVPLLRKVFAVVLFLIGVHMLWRFVF